MVLGLSNRVLVRRLAWLLFASLLGVTLGILADFTAAEPLFSPPRSVGALAENVLAALLLSPILASMGGFMVFAWMPPPLHMLFGLVGCLFWPVYALLAWRWMKTGELWLLIVLSLWCVQGFFRVLHRLEIVMSV